MPMGRMRGRRMRMRAPHHRPARARARQLLLARRAQVATGLHSLNLQQQQQLEQLHQELAAQQRNEEELLPAVAARAAALTASMIDSSRAAAAALPHLPGAHGLATPSSLANTPKVG